MKTVTMSKKHALRANLNASQTEDLSHDNQIQLINQMYLGSEVENSTVATRELVRKIQGYKGQDVKRDLHDGPSLITLEACMEKLVASRLRCYYCSRCVKMLYSIYRDPNQWTLDRLDNNTGHTVANTVICCLGCNLQRRCTDCDKFSFTKKLVVKKAEQN
jgi:hypothetical protein